MVIVIMWIITWGFVSYKRNSEVEGITVTANTKGELTSGGRDEVPRYAKKEALFKIVAK